jgi:hypothetical protein
MNDDFVKDYRREPSPEFRQALYARISQPMNTHTLPMRRVRARALGLALALVLLCGATLLTPAGRSFANQLLYRIGVITVSEPDPAGSGNGEQPTVAPAVEVQHQYVADIAAASELAGFTVLDLPSLPAGYAPSGDWAVGPGHPAVKITIVVRMYTDGAGHTLIANQFKAAPGESYEETLSPNEQAMPVDINGAQGLLIEGRLMGENFLPGNGSPELKPTNWLYWAAGGVNYTLFGDGLSADQLLAVARAME